MVFILDKNLSRIIHLYLFFKFFQRFRSYIKALVSSIRLACCNPKQLLRRTVSRSSLDIGVIPFNQNLMKVEIHRRYEKYTENTRIKKAAANALFATSKITYLFTMKRILV